MFRLVLVVILACQILPVRADSLSVAAASDLVYCLEELNAAFRKAYPQVDLKSMTGASGTIFAQIQNGAPFDVFLSADVKYPRELIKAGLAEEKSLTVYAIGHLVVWTNRDGVDVSAGLSALNGAAVKKIAIANPEHAPYGRAAKAALEQAKLWDTVKDRLVFGENIAQTAQFVETGNADAGIVALSLVMSPRLQKVGRWTPVPVEAHPKLEQAVVVTKRGASNPLAGEYVDFLRSKEAREVFDRYGFRVSE
jgi:molybdate transport system substrate-binding protein